MSPPAPARTTIRSIPSQIDEWWLLAETEVMEMAKRGVPGVFTYGFYDGWVPNYLFWIALTHNSFGRFYEVQSYGPDINPEPAASAHAAPAANGTGRIRRCPRIKWGPRNNTNIQESALLFALHKVAKEHELYLENYWLKNKRAIEKGKNGPTYAWVIPAGAAPQGGCRRHGQRAAPPGRGSAHAPTPPSKPATSTSPPGDYIIRADQPYRTLADMYFSVQNYPPANPRPYDDTGWTMQYMRNVKLTAGDRQGHSRSADDAAHGRCQGRRRHRRERQRRW